MSQVGLKNGFAPRKRKNGRIHNNKFLTFEDVKRIVNFLTNFC